MLVQQLLGEAFFVLEALLCVAKMQFLVETCMTSVILWLFSW